MLADTVGFIRKLPHHLVESFKSTLDEVREADVILHVVDISHPQFEDQMKVVNATLAELIKRWYITGILRTRPLRELHVLKKYLKRPVCMRSYCR